MSAFGDAFGSSLASSLGGGIVGAGLNAVGGIASAIGAGRQYRYQKKLMDRAYNQQVEFWNKQNEYNSPTAQMQRLSDANLNPHLIYSNGASGLTAQGVSTPSAGSATEGAHMNLASGVGAGNAMAYKGYEMMPAEMENISSDTALKNANTSRALAEAAGILSRNKWIDPISEATLKDLHEGIRKKAAEATGQEQENSLFEMRREELDARIRNIGADTKLKSSIKSYYDESATNLREMRPAQIAQIWSQIRKNNSDVRRNNVLNGLTEYQVVDICQSWTKIGAEINKIDSETELTKWMTAFYPWLTSSQIAANAGSLLKVVVEVAELVASRGASAAAKTVTKTTIPNLYGSDGKPISTTTITR
ncbi:DNA pilot protein [Peromfec virus RodF5_8]|uniref:DNA pilot protein n=1 Tax=Peromfec virus RodF5_8 TaxID=2929344 RepID=A0A976N2G5_9VIRU|nr:DNA pilot protein [Peromfec virus RodF5_8]